jgi:glycolate dehydrogenase FAD-binding subunit
MADDPVLRDLAGACAVARPAGEGDAVAGVVPRYVASPASVAEASALMRAAATHDLSVVPRGGGSKLAWGTPPRQCDLVADTRLLGSVIEHAAGDLVARVQAGVKVTALGELLATAGQQLALDPPPGLPGDGAGPADGATVGGTLATAAAGPRRLRYGTPRDLVIGITVVRADGTVARSGGKVVKNVAGYDLGKLFAGSHGTLGLIVEAVFRLHPVPAGTAYVLADCADAAAAYKAAADAAGSDLAASAVEVDRPAAGQPVRVAVLLEGDPDGVTERAAAMRKLIGQGAWTSQVPPPWWGWAAHPGDGAAGAGEPSGAGLAWGAGPPSGDGPGPGGGGAGTLVRIGFWAAAFPRVMTVIDAAAAGAGVTPAVGGSPAAGVIYAALGAGTSPEAATSFVSALRAAIARGRADARPAAAPLPDSPPALASAVVVHAPPAVREAVDMWGPVPSLSLMRAVKDQFDPGHRMAPGRFVGGL